MEPLNVLEAIEAIDEISEQINKRENDCIDKVFVRYCLLKGAPLDMGRVRRKNYPDRPNYWEYYYLTNLGVQAFLMSPELVVTPGADHVLNIKFNPMLLTEDQE